MCGIFGFIDKDNKTDPLQRKLLASLNASRGEDGTGFVVRKGGKTKWWKTQDCVTDVLCYNAGSSWWEAPMLLGHTRRASKAYGIGGVKKENAHPFSYRGVIAAHNGFVSNWRRIEARFKGKMDVDSEIFPRIVRHEIDMLSEIEGKAAVWWVDRNDENVYAWIWNQDFAVFEGDGFAVFSSDVAHLKGAGFQGYTLEGDGQIIRIKPDGQVHKISKKAGKSPPKVEVMGFRSTSQEVIPLECGGEAKMWGTGAQVDPDGYYSRWLSKNELYKVFMRLNNKLSIRDKEAFKAAFQKKKKKEVVTDAFDRASTLLEPKVWECSSCGNFCSESEVNRYLQSNHHYHKGCGRGVADCTPLTEESRIMSLACELGMLKDEEYNAIVSWLDHILEGCSEQEVNQARLWLRDASEISDRKFNTSWLKEAA